MECQNIVGKKATIEGLLSGAINESNLKDIYLIDIKYAIIDPLGEIEVSRILESVQNPDVLFIQRICVLPKKRG